LNTFERGFWRMARFSADFTFILIDFFERLCVSFGTQMTRIFKIFKDVEELWNADLGGWRCFARIYFIVIKFLKYLQGFENLAGL